MSVNADGHGRDGSVGHDAFAVTVRSRHEALGPAISPATHVLTRRVCALNEHHGHNSSRQTHTGVIYFNEALVMARLDRLIRLPSRYDEATRQVYAEIQVPVTSMASSCQYPRAV